MNDSQLTPLADHQQPSLGQSVMRVLTVLARRKLLVIVPPLLAALTALAIGLNMPSVYLSMTKLLPPQQAQSGTAALLAQLGGAAAAVSGSASIKNPNDVYVAMLSSRTIADKLIERFKLRDIYRVKNQEKARLVLAEESVIKAGKDGLITVEVTDGDPQRAAAMANAYVEELLRLTKVIAVTEASQRRVFFEQQLESAKNELAAAELSLKNSLDSGGVISVDSDSRALIETVGRVRAQISAKEVQLSSARPFVTQNNPEYIRSQQELNSLKDELSRLQNGRGPGAAVAPASKRGLENIKILRDVKYYQMLYELLAKQYEAARLDEAKDSSVIQVLDPAVAPERKAGPRILRMVAVSAALAGVVSVTLALLLEFMGRFLRTPVGASQWRELRDNLRLRPRKSTT